MTVHRQAVCWGPGELTCVYLLSRMYGGRHQHLSHPLLFGVSVTGHDQQWRCDPCRVLDSPGGVNHPICLYPEVRRIAAFESHQTSSATVDKAHCKETDKFKLKKKMPRGKKLKGRGKEMACVEMQTDWVRDRQTAGPTKAFWFYFVLINYSLQAGPQRYYSKQVQ